MIDETYSKSEFTLVVQVFKNYFILAICLLAILSMYWGVYHDRAAHYTRIHYAIINADEGDIVGPIVESFFANTSAIQSLGTYDFLDLTELETLASSNNHSLDAEVYRQVHHQHYYGAFYVHQNATQAYLSNLKGQVELVGDSVLEIVYETGRDYSVMTGGVVPIIASINKVFYQYIAQTPLIPALMNQLTDDEISQVVSANPELITSLPTFKFSDLRPIPLLIFQAPLSVGVIYLVAFAFFQFLFMTPVHQRVAESVKGFKYMVYRFVVAQIAYIVISLGYVVVNSAFGMAYDTTFGHSGFLVIWMFAFLVMSSLGSTIETLILCLVPNRIQFAGVVLVLNIVLNLSPTVGTIALTPVFYRYGYAIPVFNAYHLMHVAYFDVWKGDIGRYIGILCAWIVVWNILLPLSMLRVVRKMARIKKKAIEQKLAQETEQMVLQEQQEKVSTQN
ncbi:hypothetical protein CANTEDRAFT_103614 [Yamadazyma tenuis ATCC 10573]|uniref:DUF3533 domain-containing protein n=2 Tax=Candida tenuis TaxID=2315449 RepID=G3B0T9_CANTC|nr:uncharacterized protein CANTEDRAFT_103614 [Yamadazyma tenuis ATCC 10573]EGV64800.1 hypothetical protein CANTEDRAFT_103614 [Yamadazyma tenuis ATCC 10573]